MTKYLKMSLFVLIVFVTLGLAIAPSLLVFLFPQDNMAFNIVLFYFIYLMVLAVLSPVLVGLYALLAKELLPKALSEVIISRKEVEYITKPIQTPEAERTEEDIIITGDVEMTNPEATETEEVIIVVQEPVDTPEATNPTYQDDEIIVEDEQQ